MAKALKDQIDQKFINTVALQIEQECSGFKKTQFIQATWNKSFKESELKQRVCRIAEQVNNHIPGSYLQKLRVVQAIAPKINGLGAWFLPEFVERYGQNHFNESVKALRELTQVFSSEFAVRPYIEKNPKKMFQLFSQWTKDSNHHVRRLASEGCRSRLPWAKRVECLIKDPNLILPILESLKSDESIYVRKSVANNLNDISKDHPDLAIKIGREWMGNNPKTDWIVRHGLRTLLKKGNLQALKIIGVRPVEKIEVQSFSIQKKRICIGEDAQLHFVIHNRSAKMQKLRLEYAIHYVKKSGRLHRKVFQLRQGKFAVGAHKIKRQHSFRPMTTRVHYPGVHRLELIINGQSKGQISFQLLA